MKRKFNWKEFLNDPNVQNNIKELAQEINNDIIERIFESANVEESNNNEEGK
jgi:hypothetical protein